MARRWNLRRQAPVPCILFSSRPFPMAISSQPRMSSRPGRLGASAGRAVELVKLWTALLLSALLVASIGLGSALGQEQKRRVPGLARITTGPSEQAFSGIVQSLDMRHKILNVNTVQGGVTEIFPIKKNVTVVMADGDKLKLTELKPGTNVLIYFEQRGDRRTVKQIVVLAAEPRPSGAAKKEAPSS